MQIVIDIPEEMYTQIKSGAEGYSNYVHSAIRNGVPYSSEFDELAGMNDLIRLIKENPDLPIVPMVDAEVAGDDNGYWMGKWGHCKVTDYYCGREHVHFKDEDDEEDVLTDLEGCQYCLDRQGRDIYDLSDEEWDKLYQSVPWVKAIVVYITT